MDKGEKLSQLLRDKRYERNITQEQAAELLDVSTRWYQKMESGESLPGFKTVCKMAKELQINFAEFADDERVM